MPSCHCLWRLMAETLLSFGVQKLWDLLVRESDRFQGVDEQFDELKSDLNMLRCFLEDADAKKHTSAMVKNSVEEIKEIVYDAEDIIQTFLLKEQLTKTSNIRKRVERFACVVIDRRGLAFDIRSLSKRISKVIRDMQSLGVQKVIVNDRVLESLHEKQREMRKTFSSDNENDLVGFGLEENVAKLVSVLVKEDEIQLISVAGMGGIGKTTLARQVFNHEMVKKCFDGVAWVCVSQQFTRKYVWQTILRSLKPNHEDMTEDELQSELFGLLETQKCLIVIDDIWTEEDWDIIKPIFPRNKGWKVVITSRNEGVALHADPNCVTFRPKCLTLTESWILFQRIAFPREYITEFDEEMEEISKQMIKHCGGLPLAIKVLGGMLTAQYTLRGWKRICENIGSLLLRGTNFNGDSNSKNSSTSSVYHVLSLSFEELPLYLKHCFLYLANFPEDYPIQVEQLSYLWAAEGIPKPRHYNDATIRDVAECYIEELVKRNLVIAERDIRSLRFETCHLHDLMRELCLFKAEEDNFLRIVNPKVSSLSSDSSRLCKSRRLAMHWPRKYRVESEITNQKLRSLLFVEEAMSAGWKPTGFSFTRLQLLRVLDLSNARFHGGYLPYTIGKLIHLRYLSFYMAWISHLPSSLQNLKLLLYLNLNVFSKYPISVPNVLKEMQELRYLSLPEEMHEKTKLELGELKNLETLENYQTKNNNVGDFQQMTRLRKVSIFISHECSLGRLSSALGQLSDLEKLTIHDSRHNRMANPGEFWLSRLINLKQLVLNVKMQRLPEEKHFPAQLTTISLSGCCLKIDPMAVLERLVHLKEVSLWNRSFIGKRMVCLSDGFKQLEKLEMYGLEEWEEWIVEEGSMPNLLTLTIDYCRKLEELPKGLKCRTSLKDLSVGTIDKREEDYYRAQYIPLQARFSDEDDFDDEEEDFADDDDEENERIESQVY